ncbi:hypothetical protein MHJ25_14135 [Acinetobacter baumannii]|uniref:hypothetical protein n=1 Tax=Acinetobacter baumannii TaxID=470 RepID=UPI001EFD4855|nr:hypothetical protein [Acinetobacter baumannii]MCG9254666.1 hypothetical protein [Acinetobacter baumannii]
MMYNNYSNDCSIYSEHAEWLKLSDILNDWCKTDRTCREVKQMAILGACENGEIEYTRNDGKTFDDPVIDLQGRGILLINKKSFNDWKNRVEKPKTVPNLNINSAPKSLSDFLKSVDDEYISIQDLINIIHQNIGVHKDISEAFQILSLAIGRCEDKPNIYKKDSFQGWQKGVLSRIAKSSFKAKQVVPESERHFTLSNAIQIAQNERFEDDLPF